MKKLIAIFALVASLSFALSPVAMAQSKVDIDSVSKTVMDADLDTLLENLKTPPADDQLPEGFSDAQFVDPATASGDEGVLPASDLEGSAGSVAYSMTWDPTAAAGPAEATPDAASSSFAVRFATLNYVFFDKEITSKDLDDFKSGAEQGITGESSPEAGTETNVENIKVEGKDAVLLTYVLNDQGVQSVVQMVALPVGNCMVISMLVEASTSVDSDAVQQSAEDLVLAGTAYLGDVADSAQ